MSKCQFLRESLGCERVSGERSIDLLFIPIIDNPNTSQNHLHNTYKGWVQNSLLANYVQQYYKFAVDLYKRIQQLSVGLGDTMIRHERFPFRAIESLCDIQILIDFVEDWFEYLRVGHSTNLGKSVFNVNVMDLAWCHILVDYPATILDLSSFALVHMYNVFQFFYHRHHHTGGFIQRRQKIYRRMRSSRQLQEVLISWFAGEDNPSQRTWLRVQEVEQLKSNLFDGQHCRHSQKMCLKAGES